MDLGVIGHLLHRLDRGTCGRTGQAGIMEFVDKVDKFAMLLVDTVHANLQITGPFDEGHQYFLSSNVVYHRA